MRSHLQGSAGGYRCHLDRGGGYCCLSRPALAGLDMPGRHRFLQPRTLTIDKQRRDRPMKHTTRSLLPLGAIAVLVIAVWGSSNNPVQSQSPTFTPT